MLSLVELQRVVRVLAPAITGQRLQQVAQPDAQSVVLTSYGAVPGADARRCHLLMSADPDAARLALLAAPSRRLPKPPAFTQYLRAHWLGARVAGVRLLGGDRVAALDLEGAAGRARMLLQILGKRSNLYLLDADACLLAALRPLAATRPELAVGEPWHPPSSGPPRSGEDRFAARSDAELFAALERHYAQEASTSDHGRLRRRLEQALRKDERRLDRKLAKLEAELSAAREASGLGRQGELLKGALSRVRRGDREVTLRDPETGEPASIELDPALSPAENLDSLFRRYRKAVRRLARGGAQQDAVRDARRALAALAEAYREVADDPGALRVWSETPAARELLERHARREGDARPRARPSAEVQLGGRTLPRRLLPRRYRTAGGLEIWVGRSDAANDFLTTRLARGKDLFFHLEGAPGSHVVLRTGGRDDPPPDAILDACELAVHHSKQRKASRADVHVVPIKNVRKPRGAKPGLVMVHGGRTIHLRRTPARLERILAARFDDP